MGPYDRGGKKSKVSFEPDFPLGPQPGSMDSSASSPAPIVPMEEHNTVPKRQRPVELATQIPPSLPPPPPGGAAILRATAQDDDARTVAYEDEDYQGGADDDAQTVNYAEPEELPKSPKGEKRKDPEHTPLLPIASNSFDPDDDAPAAEQVEKKKRSVLTPGSSSSSSSKGPKIGNQDIW